MTAKGGTAESERGNWSGKLEALLSYIGYCVGLGNVWRFPYLCYRNGGGAFLIPYFLMMLLAGLPLYFLELALGQYSSMSVATVWMFSPFFKGVGWCAVVACALCCIYYNQIIAYVLFYLVASMNKELPWASCGNDWNTDACRVRVAETAENTSLVHVAENGHINSTSLLSASYNIVNLTAINSTSASAIQAKSPAEEYWENFVLHKSSGLDDFGQMDWKLALSLFVAWVLVFLCLIKGIKTTGKVVYVTATFPYLVLTILLIRGLTLPGAVDGLVFYLVPDFTKLRNAKVWGDAASQIFYSLGPAWGILVTYSSYNKYNHNSHRDAVVSSFVCTGTSVFAGLVVFSAIGFIAHELELPIKDVMSSGPGLVFIVYPEALARMPLSPLWAVIFFLMLLTISLDSMFATFETVVSAIVDEFPQYFMKRRTTLTAAMCFLFFILGLPQASQAGIYILTLMDWYIGTFPPLFIGLCEVLVISYIYGYRRFASHITDMMGFTPNLYWRLTWNYITPAAILFIIIFNAVIYAPVALGSYQYPGWGEGIGWLLACSSLTFIPIFMVVKFFQKIGGCRNLRETLRRPWTGETMRKLLQPEPEWGPQHERQQKLQQPSLYNGLIDKEMKEMKEINANKTETAALNV